MTNLLKEIKSDLEDLIKKVETVENQCSFDTDEVTDKEIAKFFTEKRYYIEEEDDLSGRDKTTKELDDELDEFLTRKRNL